MWFALCIVLYLLKVYHHEFMLNMQTLRFEHYLTLKAVRYYKYSINVGCFMYCFTSLKVYDLEFYMSNMQTLQFVGLVQIFCTAYLSERYNSSINLTFKSIVTLRLY